jgi:hypothetical protein
MTCNYCHQPNASLDFKVFGTSDYEWYHRDCMEYQLKKESSEGSRKSAGEDSQRAISALQHIFQAP